MISPKLRQIIKEEIRKVLKENAEIYPFKASSKDKQLYNNIAKELETLILKISQILKIPKSNIRAFFDFRPFFEENTYSGLTIQIKPLSDKWEKPGPGGNNLIMQSTSENGIIINSDDIEPYTLDGIEDDKLLNIYKMSKKNNLHKLVLNFAKNTIDKLSEQDLKLVAPNTPIVVTGK